LIRSNEPELLSWLQQQLSQRPEMEPRDAYKLLYQGILGSEHLIDSPESFARWLVEELDAVGAGDSDALWESIRTDGALGRLNLRSFKAHAGDPSLLVTVCLETARRKWGTLDELKIAWDLLMEANQSTVWAGWNIAELIEVTRLIQANNYPALHHSRAYQAAYHPAYRLVAANLLPGLEITFSK